MTRQLAILNSVNYYKQTIGSLEYAGVPIRCILQQPLVYDENRGKKRLRNNSCEIHSGFVPSRVNGVPKLANCTWDDRTLLIVLLVTTRKANLRRNLSAKWLSENEVLIARWFHQIFGTAATAASWLPIWERHFNRKCFPFNIKAILFAESLRRVKCSDFEWSEKHILPANNHIRRAATKDGEKKSDHFSATW